jgi:thiol:disulfide interchange protein
LEVKVKYRAAHNIVAAALILASGVLASAQHRVIYSATANAHADIAQAIRTATREHKRVLLDFGGNWCGDCQVLDIYMHQAPNDAVLAKRFVVVHVDIGKYDKNLDLAEKYNIPLKRGVPAMAILGSHGKLLYSQQHGEFEDMRHMDSASLTEFLNKWKG